MSDETQAFLDLLREDIRVNLDGPYTPLDRYRDFATTFKSEIGKRVLRQIVDLCEDGMPREDDPPAKLAAYVARRRVGQKISAWTFMPPLQRA